MASERGAPASGLRADAAVASSNVHQQGRREDEGAMGVPGRILSTLQRKFWDSNKVRGSCTIGRPCLVPTTCGGARMLS